MAFKTLKWIKKMRKESFKIPRTVQDTIPIQKVCEDGLFLIGRQQYTMTFQFEDINYSIASLEIKESIYRKYSALLNSFDNGALFKLTIRCRRLTDADFDRDIKLPLKGDERDCYRQEFNNLLRKKATQTNAIVLDKFVTVSTFKTNIKEAQAFFSRIQDELTAQFARLGSRMVKLDLQERLDFLHEFYRAGEAPFAFDLQDASRKGHHFLDGICPDAMEFQKDHFTVNSRYGRVLFLKEYANRIDDNFLSDLSDVSRKLIFSLDILPVPVDEAVRETEKILLGLETNITKWQQNQNRNDNYSAQVPMRMEEERKEAEDILRGLSSRDQRLFFTLFTFVLTADSMDELNNDTEKLIAFGQNKSCQIAVHYFKQKDGLATALPMGAVQYDLWRSITTENLAMLIPFKVQEVMHKNGIYQGVNAKSRNLILCDKSRLMNSNAFRLGIPGSGKSFGAKLEIALLALLTDDDVLVSDPENEYSALIEALGGTVIDIAAGGKDFINAMDLEKGYSDNLDPIVDKMEFTMALFQRMEPECHLSRNEKSLIDRCTRMVYEQNPGKTPTLFDLRQCLLEQKEPEAKNLALALELHTEGSLNTFAHETNVDTQNRLVVYNISRLGKEQKGIGQLVITDAMRNRVARNWAKGKRTHLFYDEIHVMFEDSFTSAFLCSAWRQFRKRNAYPTGITQNVGYLLHSPDACTMLSNSEFIVMGNQSAGDREDLAQLLNISPEQMDYITDANGGSGLLRMGESLVPFDNQFPNNTKLYSLITTKPGEKSGETEEEQQD